MSSSLSSPIICVRMHTLVLASLVVQLMGGVKSVDVGRQVVVVSLDGFPKEQLSKHPLEHLTRVYAHGSQPRRFINQFPTKSFPNHFSVATGMYQESHGVVGNTVFDKALNRTLTIKDSELFTQNPGVMPLWTLNEQLGGSSGCIMWPGCDVTFHGRNVTYWEPYQHNASLSNSVDLAVKWLTHDMVPANLIFLYHDQPDMAGHVYGPDSSYYRDMLKKVDAGVGYLFHLLDLRKLRQKVDVIILSDHGTTSVSAETGIIDLSSVLSPKLYTFTGGSPVLNVWPVEGKDLYVYDRLKNGSPSNHYKVFLKENPQMKAWHYRDNPRISSITLVSDVGYVFQDFRNNIKNFQETGYPGLTEMFGDHGYEVDNPSMEPIFVAVGPSFRQKFIAENFSNIDVYPLVCMMLGLSPGPNNGSLNNIQTILARPISSLFIEPLLVAVGTMMLGLLLSHNK
ncbi:bis(5'-adenosyl)-triphosphatase enpp4-like isoform X3 [Portunus trituberculatus]|nr:bis(5'-adenosyl)-triphosphatase enpp4-like isoform X3 [Portunus trituberculatus]XP_045103891.1 bis(5'-adenosyl)-triphosphatase enpp4-like isoform X3 [Portunus trituberculatus]